MPVGPRRESVGLGNQTQQRKKKECFIKGCYTFYAAYSSRFVAWRSFVCVGVQETKLAPCLVRASRSRCGVRKTWEDPGALCLLFVRTVNWRPPGTLVFLSTAFFDGQHKHEHAGTGAGRQVHAATRRTGRLDQEPRPTRQNGRAQVSLGALTVKESVRVGARIASPERAGRWAVVLSAVFFSPCPFSSRIWVAKTRLTGTPPAGLLQEICAYTAAADCAHTLGARHARSEDEVDTGPQGTEKQVSFGSAAAQSPHTKQSLVSPVLTVCLVLVSSSHLMYHRLDSERARLLNCLREVRFTSPSP